MKFPPQPKPISTLWDNAVSMMVMPPILGTPQYVQSKALFYSGIIAFMDYQKQCFPVVPKVPTPQQKKHYTEQLQKMYDDAVKELENLVEGANAKNNDSGANQRDSR